MNKLDYEKAIRNLMKEGYQTSVVHPTVQDLKPFCPHLTEDQIALILQKDTYFACPSLVIKNALIVLHYNRYEGKDQLEYTFTSRTPQSYEDDKLYGKLHGNSGSKYIFTDEAISYANTQWGDTLVIDNWEAFMTIHVQDPTKLDDRGHPANIFNLYITLKRDYNKFINEHDKPQFEKFDEEIVIATTDRFITGELQGGRGGYTDFNCAHCGGGLSLKYCTCCKNEFKDDQFRCGWNTPLSDKMIKALTDRGHVFGIDPKIAQEKERTRLHELLNE